MEPVSAVVSGLSLIVITVVSIVALVNHDRLRRNLNDNVKSVVDQVNNSQYNVYKFDQKQEENLQKVNSSIKALETKTKAIDGRHVSDRDKLQGEINKVKAESLTKASIAMGVPYVKSGEVQLGTNYLLSESINNEAKKKDASGWLNVLNRQGTDYAGGIATNSIKAFNGASFQGKVSTSGLLDVQGNLQVTGGTSEYNPDGLMTQFPAAADKKNYIRGDTSIKGSASTAGDLTVGRNMNVDGRLHFKDATYDTKSTSKNNTDSFYLEKKVGNNSSLRLTINDTDDSTFQIWGNACATGNCNGEGTVAHKFSGGGNQWTKGTISAGSVNGGRISVNNNSAWLGADGSAYMEKKVGVGIAPNNMNDLMLAVDGGKPGQWNTMIRNGQTSVLLANNVGTGVKIDTQKGTRDAALQVYSANGELLAVQNDGYTRVGRPDGIGETKVMSLNTTVKRHIDAWSDWANQGDKALFAGWNGRKVILGNGNASGSEDYAKTKTPPIDSVVSANPHYIHNTLKVAKTKDDKYPANWPSGIHTSYLYSDQTIAAGTNGSLNAYINSKGEIYSAAGSVVGSDIRLKEDINTLSKEELQKINNLRPVSYNLKADEDKKRKYGFIAQEVEKVYPTMVTNNKDGIKAVNYDAFVPVVVGNIQSIKRSIPNDKQICIGDTCITEADLLKLKKLN